MVLSRQLRWGRDDGAVIVLVALLLTALFGITAIVIDLGNARQVSRHAQASVDAGALAGAQDLPTAPDAKEVAAKYVNQNLTGNFSDPSTTGCGLSAPPAATCYAVGDATVTVATPYDTGGTIPAARLIYVQICEPTDTFFAAVIGATSPTVCRDAVGRNVSSGGGLGMGLIAMDEAACPALDIAGNADITITSGAALSRSECTTGSGSLLTQGTNWSLDADFVGSVGTRTHNSCQPSTCSTADFGDVEPFADPFGLPSNPTPTNTTARSCTFSGPPGVRTLEPGVYANACNISQPGTYVFRPGEYFFRNGISVSGDTDLICQNSVTSTACDGVTFVVTGGTTTLGGQGNIDLEPPISGQYAGVSVHQTSSGTATFAGKGAIELGTIYAPNAEVLLEGNGVAIGIEGSVLGRTIRTAGNFSLNIDASGAPTTAGAAEVGLEQ